MYVRREVALCTDASYVDWRQVVMCVLFVWL